MFGDALAYPVKGAGVVVLIMGSIFAVLVQLAGFVPLVGLLAAVFLVGYFAAYYYQILQRTATGNNHEAEFPDVSEFLDDIILPAFQIIGVLIISNLLWALAILVAPDNHVLQWLGRAFGAFYFPMALLSMIIHGHLGGTNPLIVLPSILRTLPRYCIVAAVAMLLSFATNATDRLNFGIPVFGWAIPMFAFLYFITAHARMLGLFYRLEEERLDWL